MAIDIRQPGDNADNLWVDYRSARVQFRKVQAGCSRGWLTEWMRRALRGDTEVSKPRARGYEQTKLAMRLASQQRTVATGGLGSIRQRVCVYHTPGGRKMLKSSELLVVMPLALVAQR